MKKILLAALLFSGAQMANAQSIIPDPEGEAPKPSLYFYENLGQIADENGTPHKEIKYYIDGSNARAYLGEDAIHYTLRLPGDTLAPDTVGRLDMFFGDNYDDRRPYKNIQTHDVSSDVLNYYLPSCPAGGVEGVKGFGTVSYLNAFDGINAHFTSNSQGPVLYLEVRPGADPNQLQFSFLGQDALQLVGGGVLAKMQDTKFYFPQAIAYQYDNAGNLTPLNWLPIFTLPTSNKAKLNITGGYDPNQTLVFKIGYQAQRGTSNPTGLDWATYYDGAGSSFAAGVFSDSYAGADNSNVRISTLQGQSGTSFTGTVGQTTNPNSQTCSFISVFDGTAVRKWATYYSNTTNNYPTSPIAISASTDKVYITGWSGNMTTVKTAQDNNSHGAFYQANGEVFLASFNKVSGQLYWATNIDGNRVDYNGATTYPKPTAMYIDATTSRLYLAGDLNNINTSDYGNGYTAGTFPLLAGSGSRYFDGLGGLSISHKSFIMEWDISNNNLLWSTSFSENINTIKAQGGEFALTLYIGGATANDVIPSTISSTPITAPPSGNNVFPLVNPGNGAYFQSSLQYIDGLNKADGYLASFNKDYQLDWCTYFGGNGKENITSIALDGAGDIYAAGSTTTTQGSASSATALNNGLFPLYHNPAKQGYYQTTFGGGTITNTGAHGDPSDDFIVKFDVNKKLQSSTYFGGASNEGVLNYRPGNSAVPHPVLNVDGNGNVIMAGSTQKPNVTNPNTATIPVTANTTGQPAVYNQGQNASSNEALTGYDAYYAQFTNSLGAAQYMDNKLIWSTDFGGDGNNNPSPNSTIRADEQVADASMTNGRVYSILNSQSLNTPPACPAQVPGQPAPYCDPTYHGSTDVFVNGLPYVKKASTTGIGSLGNKDLGIAVSPNPTRSAVAVSFIAQESGNVAVLLTDAMGKKITTKQVTAKAGKNNFILSMEGLSSGIYFLNLTSTQGHEAVRIVKY